MSEQENLEVSEAQIAVHWQEEDKIPPPREFVAQANMTDASIYDRFSLDNFPDYFQEYADLLDWYKYWHTTLDTSDAPCWKWFVGGELNASYNCVDRHLKDNQNKAAIIFAPEPEEEAHQVITYRELYARVNETAALLRDFCGVQRGDRLTIHLAMVPDLPVVMLACARIGAIHSVVFGGFSGQACADRLVDSGSKVLITMDAYYRNGKLLSHKEKADEAVAAAAKDGQTVEKVLVYRRYPNQYHSDAEMVEGRDYFVDEVMKDYKDQRVEPERMKAEEPLFLMYTSGTTGKPKGCQHGTGGYLAYAAATSKYVQDIHPNDVYWCMADIGWITGHSYIVYGPLSLGTTTVIYEGVPNYPDPKRPWRLSHRLGINIFHTAPTAIRMLRKADEAGPAEFDIQFKHMTTVGEPIEPEVWRWYFEVVGKGQAAIVDTWWQTETGGFLCTTIPGIHGMKAGSAGPAMPGIHPVILDDNGEALPDGQAGTIVIQNPWPGQFQTIWGDRERYVQTYFAKYNTDPESKDWRDWCYIPGDAAVRAPDGYFRILGRMDDVINVAGHRLGTKELESAALIVEAIAEAAVVPVNDEVKGKVPDLYVSLKPGYDAGDDIKKAVMAAVTKEIGPIARPKNVYIVSDMPKTRSGKIMRRVLSALSNGTAVGNTMTLANPEVVAEINEMMQEN